MSLISIFKRNTRKTLSFFGFDLVRINNRMNLKDAFEADIPQSLINTFQKVKPYTMTSPERIFSLCDAVKYVHENKIDGDIVECGVWRGGSMMAVADTLLGLGDVSRSLYLFDTFEGMVPPTDDDIDISGVSAEDLLSNTKKTNDDSVWCYAGLDSVKSAVGSVGYPADKIHFVQGMVEQTIPEHAPKQIALLRLDTDWYESTKHEMEHLFPRLARGGVLIVDDYGHWQGAKKAIDEYLTQHQIKMFLNRIDYTGRIAVKLD